MRENIVKKLLSCVQTNETKCKEHDMFDMSAKYNLIATSQPVSITSTYADSSLTSFIYLFFLLKT